MRLSRLSKRGGLVEAVCCAAESLKKGGQPVQGLGSREAGRGKGIVLHRCQLRGQL